MSYHTVATKRLSCRTTKIIDSADHLGLVELEELRFIGWVLEGVKDRVSRAGRPYLTYTFNRAAEPERRSA
jgi:hypothetical protein